MKKLKIQTELIAICLALPITFKISNATTAKKQPNQVQNDEPIVQNSNTTGDKETINLADTFLNKLKEYIEITDCKKPFNYLQKQEFLLYYIDNDITKYLTLKILINFDQLPTHPTPTGDRYITRIHTDTILDDLTQELQFKPITTKKGTKVQVSNILNFIKDIDELGIKYPNPLTTEEQILQFLCANYMSFFDPQKQLQRLERLLDYYKEEYSTVESKNSIFQKVLSLLSLVADRLDLENYCQNNGDPNSILAQLAKQVREFIEIYNDKRLHPQPPPLPEQKVIEFSEGYNKALIKQQAKRLKQQQEQQPLIKKPPSNAITRTYTRALQYFLKPKKGKKTVLRGRHYKQFLRNYINGNTATYLSLLIQANYGIITFPANIIRDASEGYYEGDYYNNLYHQLLNDYTPVDSYSFMNTYEAIDEIKDILATLRQLRTAAPEGLTTTKKILKAVFTQDEQWEEDPNEKINLLQPLIEEYNKQPPTAEDDPNDNILIKLGDIAQQLQDEADEQQDPFKKDQLLVLAHKIQSFYSAYRDKEPGTFYQTLKDHVSQNPEREPLTEQQLKKLLKKYTRNDIPKYLALMMQTNYEELSFIPAKDNKPIITSPPIKKLLFEKPTQAQRLIDDDEKNKQLSKILEDLCKIRSKEGKTTPEEEILSLLFIHPRGEYEDAPVLGLLKDKIEAYKRAVNITVDQSYSTIINKFDKVTKQLLRENDERFPGTRETFLGLLAKLVNAFREEYNNKLDQQKREKEEAEKAKREQEEREKREKREQEARAHKIEQLIIKANKDLEQNKRSNSKLSTTQKITNNLSATNKMLQIIKLILY